MQSFYHQFNILQSEAKKLGIPITAICREAKTNRSTPTRWKNRSNSPNMDKWNAFQKAFDKLKDQKNGKEK